jgi:hypothetical protein
MRIPLDMKAVYFCRHILESQNLFSSLEAKARKKTEEQYRDYQNLTDIEIERVIDINHFDPNSFLEDGGFDTPFLIKGVFSSNALQWDQLRETYGDSLVPVHPAAKLGESWQYETVREMTLRDAMRAMEQGAPISVVSSSQVFVDHSQLLETMKPRVLSDVFGAHFVRHEMFVAGPGTGSAFHCAVGGNFFHMVNGRKRWLLVNPSDSFAMYPTIGRNTRSAIFGSPINSESYQEDQRELFPLYSRVPKYLVILEPGDVLFVPSWWWHEVKNLEPSIGFPFRAWIPGKNHFFLLLTMLSINGIKNLPRALAARITKSPSWMMKDSIPRESFARRA